MERIIFVRKFAHVMLHQMELLFVKANSISTKYIDKKLHSIVDAELLHFFSAFHVHCRFVSMININLL